MIIPRGALLSHEFLLGTGQFFATMVGPSHVARRRGAVKPVIAPDEGCAPAATDAIVQGGFPRGRCDCAKQSLGKEDEMYEAL